MAWIELHQSLPQNKKTLRLCKLLGIRTPQAMGHLCLLWLWALDNAESGELTDLSDAELAQICLWRGRDASFFVSALLEAGFLTETHAITNWGSYTGRLMEQRAQRREQAKLRQRRYREEAKNQTRDSSVTSPPTNQPYQTNRTNKEKNSSIDWDHLLNHPEAYEKEFKNG